MNKIKLIATLGPGTQSEEKIVELIQAGIGPEITTGHISYGSVSSR